MFCWCFCYGFLDDPEATVKQLDLVEDVLPMNLQKKLIPTYPYQLEVVKCVAVRGRPAFWMKNKIVRTKTFRRQKDSRQSPSSNDFPDWKSVNRSARLHSCFGEHWRSLLNSYFSAKYEHLIANQGLHFCKSLPRCCYYCSTNRYCHHYFAVLG